MSKKLFLIIIPLVLFINKAMYSQDPAFSQFYANPLYLNPALTGSQISPRLVLNYRNQWPSLSNSFNTYSASYDLYLDALHGGVGVSLIADNAGDGALKTNIISGFYSYRLIISKSIFMNAGFQATYFQTKLDWDKLKFGDQYDPKSGFVLPTGEIPPNRLDKGFVDFSSGFLFSFSNKYFAGVSVNHLTNPDNGFYENSESKLDMKITGHIGTMINLSEIGTLRSSLEDIILSPNILYQQQSGFQQLDFGLYLNKYPFVSGVWFRYGFNNADALILLVGFEQDKFKIGYSYDMTVSNLRNSNTGGSHEISFSYKFPNFDKRRKRIKIKDLDVPPF